MARCNSNQFEIRFAGLQRWVIPMIFVGQVAAFTVLALAGLAVFLVIALLLLLGAGVPFLFGFGLGSRSRERGRREMPSRHLETPPIIEGAFVVLDGAKKS